MIGISPHQLGAPRGADPRRRDAAGHQPHRPGRADPRATRRSCSTWPPRWCPAARSRSTTATASQMPVGWAVDENGYDCQNPGQVLKNLIERVGGGILPLGGRGEEYSGYKGYGLSLMVDILCGVLSGAAYGPNVDDVHGKPGGRQDRSSPTSGTSSLAIDIARFMPLEEFVDAPGRLHRPHQGLAQGVRPGDDLRPRREGVRAHARPPRGRHSASARTFSTPCSRSRTAAGVEPPAGAAAARAVRVLRRAMQGAADA